MAWSLLLPWSASLVTNWWPGTAFRVGRRIGSAALVADGLHARADGFTSLAVLLGVGGAVLGWRGPTRSLVCSSRSRSWACCDQRLRQVGARLMDAVVNGVVDQAVDAIGSVEGIDSRA